jgi:Protein of unknown function (DUF3224)
MRGTPFNMAVIAAILIASPVTAKEPEMQHAKGEFEVKLVKISADDDALMRMSIDKQFSGDLVATSTGQMLAGGNEGNGARVYVALETVAGVLDGKSGSFILAHRGTMAKTGQALSVIVVPDSGTGELAGIDGTLDIQITGGKHFYTFDYTLPN